MKNVWEKEKFFSLGGWKSFPFIFFLPTSSSRHFVHESQSLLNQSNNEKSRELTRTTQKEDKLFSASKMRKTFPSCPLASHEIQHFFFFFFDCHASPWSPGQASDENVSRAENSEKLLANDFLFSAFSFSFSSLRRTLILIIKFEWDMIHIEKKQDEGRSRHTRERREKKKEQKKTTVNFFLLNLMLQAEVRDRQVNM